MTMWNPDHIEEFRACVEDLLKTDEVQQMRGTVQHMNISCYDHCVFVSYMSFLFCKRFNLDFNAAARGGLLHDLFLYDWHVDPHEGMHGFSHPKAALKNARKLCDLSHKEEDIIVKHMWPLTLRAMPKYRESFVVCGTDKVCALLEMLLMYRAFRVGRHLSLAT